MVHDQRKKTEKIKSRGKRGILSLLFGRTSIVLMLLVIQIMLLIGLVAQWQGSLYAYGGTLLLSIIMTIYLTNKDMKTASRQTWLILVLLVPLVGTLMYLYFEMDVGYRFTRDRLEDIRLKSKDLVVTEPSVMSALSGSLPNVAGLASYMKTYGDCAVFHAGDIAYFSSGEKMFRSMLAEMKKATRFIFLEFFILEDGYVWSEILDILREKVRQGVEVRVMYDGTNAVFRMPYRYPRKLVEMGIQAKMFAPIQPILSTYHNNRDHRKIVVIDGKVAYTGGINLADEYVGKRIIFGHWKDSGILLRGSAVDSFTLMFLQMWNTPSTEIRFSEYLNTAAVSDKPDNGYIIPFGDNPFRHERIGKHVYLHMINNAERYLHIMTPYLILGDDMIDALVFAAQRGVDVRILLPHIPDKRFAFAVAYTHYAPLLNGGVRIYEYTPGFVHSKSVVSDDIHAVIGTINLDFRSLDLHFECGAYVYNSRLPVQIERDFERTLEHCQEILPEDLKHMPLYRKVVGRILKPLAPLM